MSKITIADWYKRVNATWPDEVPAPTPIEATRAAKKLYRFAMGRKFTGKIKVTSGNRFTWINNHIMYVNPKGQQRGGFGWKGLVHNLSHWAAHQLNDDCRPHSGAHARLEIRMIKQVIKRGWLKGALLKPVTDAPPIDANERKRTERAKQYVSVLRRLETWEAKHRRAVNALKKLDRQIKRLDQLGAKHGNT